MSDASLLEAEARRVLERIRSIPKSPMARRKRPGLGVGGTGGSASYVEEAREEGTSALSRVKMTMDAQDEVLVRARLDGPRTYAAERPERDERQEARMGQLRQWASDQAALADDLIDAAMAAMRHGVAPLTGIRYGAALLTRGGFVFAGCNIESNESSLSTSAEKSAILQAVAQGHTEFQAIAITWDQTETDRFPMPSGASRQYLAEFGDFDVVLVRADPARTRKQLTTYELLPHMPRTRSLASTSASQPSSLAAAASASGSRSPARSRPVLVSPAARARKSDFVKTPVRQWSVRHVLAWLDEACELPSYQHNFKAASVNGNMLLQLAAQDLQDVLGVHHPVHLAKLRGCVDELRRREVFEAGAQANDVGDMVAIMGRDEIVMVARLKEAFDQVDAARAGRLEVNQLKSALQLLGCQLPTATIHSWAQMHGSDGTLTFPQFVQAFLEGTRSQGADGDNEERGEKGRGKNERLVVSSDGHVTCRENQRYDDWLQAQQKLNGARLLSGGTSTAGVAGTGGVGPADELALWLRGDEEAAHGQQVKSFLRLRKRPKSGFLAASLEVSAEDFARLKRLFDRADRDRAGEITRFEAAKALCKTGMKVTAVEMGQYLRLQGLDSASPVDVFEFARAFAYFVRQRDIHLGRSSSAGAATPVPGTSASASALLNLDDEHVRWPAAYDPTGLIGSLRRHNRSKKKRKHASRKHRSKKRGTRRRSRSRHRHDSESSSDSDSDSDAESDSSSSAGSSSSSSASSSSSDSSASSDSDSSSASSSSSSASSSASSSEEEEEEVAGSRRKKHKRVHMGKHVVKRVTRAFVEAQRRGTGGRDQLPVNAVLGALRLVPRSRRSRGLPSKEKLRGYFEARGVQYYVSRKLFVAAFAHLCYDSLDEDFVPKKTRTKKRRAKGRSKAGRGGISISGSGSNSSSDSDSEGSSGSGSDASTKLRRGQVVEARWQGKFKWYGAEVTRVNANGSVNLLYDDGNTEKSVKPALVRPSKKDARKRNDARSRSRSRSKSRSRSPSKKSRGRRGGSGGGGSSDDDDDDGALCKGAAVTARFKGGAKFYKGTIARVNANGTFDVKYADGDFEQNVKRGSIKPQEKPERPQRRRQGRRRGRGQGSDSGSDSGSGSGSDSDGGFAVAVGSKVEARFKNGSKWYKGTVRRANSNGTFDIDYADGDKELRVAPSKVRAVGGADKGGRTGKAGSPRRRRGARLKRGVKVTAKFKGGKKFFKGEVSRDNGDGTFAVKFDDGDFDAKVREADIKPSASASAGVGSGSGSGSDGGDAEITQGARVEAKFKNGSKWYKGKVGRVNVDGSFNVDYDDGDSERRLSASSVRLLESASASASASAAKRRSKKATTRSRFSDSDDSGDGVDVDADAAAPLAAGDRVEARFKGGSKFFPGVVDRVYSSGACDVTYDDGDREKRVRAQSIRRAPGAPARRDRGRGGSQKPLSRGDAVEAKFKNGTKWYKGKVSRANANGTFDVAYADGDSERGVKAANVRAVGGERGLPRRRPATLAADSDDDAGDEGLRRGQAVEARFGGKAKWFKGKVSRENANGTYDITYDDGDSERGVRKSLIRALKTASPRRRALDDSGDDGSEDDGKELRRGQAVEARFGGKSKWYKGKISRVNVNGTYDVTYDDGDSERGVKSALVRAMKKASPRRRALDDSGDDGSDEDGKELRRGQAVEARYGGKSKWYKGKISRVNVNGTYDITYDDGDSERGVKAALVRVTGGKSSSSPSRDSRRRPNLTVDSEAEEEEEEESGALRRGQAVEARYGGKSKWYKGKISRVNVNGTYDVTYDDGDSERGVKAALVRALGGSDSPPEEVDGLRRGQAVEARFGGKSKWYKGKVSRANANGTYDITYEDGDSERGVRASLVRSLKKASPRRRAQGHSDDDDSEEEAGALRRGQAVEARYGGKSKWYKGKISRVNATGTYDVTYDDGDSERGVRKSLVRALGGKSSSPPSRDSRRQPSLTVDSEDENEAGALRRGQAVEARFGGKSKWYKGKISRVNVNGTYDVTYDDGDSERGVRASLVRALGGGSESSSGSAGDLRRGQAVEARFGGKSKWFKGKISRVNVNGTFDVTYDDGDSERGVRASLVRALGGGGGGGGGGGHESDSEQEDDGYASVSFRAGDRVEARFKGGSKHFAGSVSRVNADGSLDVDYDDGDSERRVPASRVRRPSRSAGAGDRSGSGSGAGAGAGAGAGGRGAGTRGGRGGPASNGLSVGAKVEARFRGGRNFFKGEISRDHRDGTFDIVYDDGDKAQGVPERDIKPLAAGEDGSSDDGGGSGEEQYGERLQEGDRVEGRFRGKGTKWFAGEVTRVHTSGACDVLYDDGDSDRRLDARHVRPVAKKPARRSNGGSGGSGARRASFAKDDSSPRRSSPRARTTYAADY